MSEVNRSADKSNMLYLAQVLRSARCVFMDVGDKRVAIAPDIIELMAQALAEKAERTRE